MITTLTEAGGKDGEPLSYGEPEPSAQGSPSSGSVSGELAELVAAQLADDVNWIRPDVPRHLRGRPFDESRFGGWGEPDPRSGAGL